MGMKVAIETKDGIEVSEMVEDEVIERPYTLRKLKDADLWKVLKILKKTLPDDIVKLFLSAVSGGDTAEKIGMIGVMNVATEVIKNMDKAEDEITEFCADLAGITAEELNEMEFGTTPLIIMDVATNTKNISFFKVLSKFFS